MTATNSTPRQKERLEVRLDAGLKQLALDASALDNTDLTTLVTRGLKREIEDIQQRHRVIPLSAEAFERFKSLVEMTRPMSPSLKRAAESLEHEGFDFGIPDGNKTA